MKQFVALAMAFSVIVMLSMAGLAGFGIVSGSATGVEAANTALANMTDDITTLLTDIIPVFIILGVFGAVIAYVGKLSRGFGGS